MIKWHTGDGLRRSAENAATDLGLSTRHANALAEGQRVEYGLVGRSALTTHSPAHSSHLQPSAIAGQRWYR